MNSSIFHLSLHVRDLAESRDFYVKRLGCVEGRSGDDWIDFDFFGHQLSLHLGQPVETQDTGVVDGVAVPMPHFGAVLEADVWQSVVRRLQAADTQFVLEPQERYSGEAGAQHTLFLRDPSGNAIELKSMNRADELFAGNEAK